MEIGRRVGCLASSFPDANNHILGKLPAVESRAGALGRIADALCEYVEDDAADSARYRWLRHNSGYSIRCSLFGEVGMHEHKDADLDALIDAQMTPKRQGKRRRFSSVRCTVGFGGTGYDKEVTMDNFHFDMTSTGGKELRTALSLFPQHTVTGYRVDQEKGLILYWAESSKATALPFPMTLEQAADFAHGWLEHADYGSEPDHDGYNRRGWRLYTESWGHVCGEWQAFAAVQPAWAMYGK